MNATKLYDRLDPTLWRIELWWKRLTKDPRTLYIDRVIEDARKKEMS